MSFSRNALFSAALFLTLGAGCTCGIFDPSTTRFSCSTDEDCAEGFSCRPAGGVKECVARTTAAPNGEACTVGADCESTFCAAGVCCESSCTGECETCALNGSRGRCLPKVGGTTCGTDYVCNGQSSACPTSCTGTAQCTSGRDCVNSACVDINECNTPKSCDSTDVCVNTPGSWECRCGAGFVGTATTGGPASCTDVDECATSPDCGTLAVCANIPGSYECRCPMGTFGATVTGGPTSCSTVDRCTTIGMCGANATCNTTATSYSCTCNTGYSGTTTMGAPANCVDTNECTSPTSACGSNANCTNSVGSYQCACSAGFTGASTTGMPATCVDVDECLTASCGSNAHCTNTMGSYTCSCDADFVGTPVTGGPATCTAIDRCAGVSCGANATCATVPGNYTCTCNMGFTGAAVTGGAASCADIDECATMGGVCGANATCSNTPAGSYTCTCAAGYSGATTMGMAATCVSGPVELGSVQGITPQQIPITQNVAVGTGVAVAVYAPALLATSISDSRGNTWTRVVNSNTCGACNSAGLYTTTLTTALGPGDLILVGGNTGVPIGAWATTLSGYQFFDLAGTYNMNNDTITPSVSTSAAVTQPDEFVIAALTTRNNTTLTSSLSGGFDTELSTNLSQLSGIIVSKVATGLSGVQTYSATSSSSERFSGFIATFYGGMQTAPTNLSLAHTPNSRSFTVSWTAGRGNGGGTGCAVQFQNATGSWITVQNTSCDTDANARAINLPAGTNWYGSAWSSVQVRVIRNSDQTVLGTFPTNLSCANRVGSTTPTPTVDEDCDGTWDDHTCQSFNWVRGTLYPAPNTACTNVADTTPAKACSSTNEFETRYTEGFNGTQPPLAVFSSSSVGTTCAGPMTGATAWDCAGQNCTYR